MISLETSLRMTWEDPRLIVSISDGEPKDFILFRPEVMKHIWVPDVYIDGIQELRSPAYKVKISCLSTIYRAYRFLKHRLCDAFISTF